jgi:Zn-dependent M32 family carboxypeptidase
MDRIEIEAKLNGIIDDLANIEHARWSHWQKYLHNKCERLHDGSLVIPSDLVEQWQQQIDTPYQALSEAEKESDRDQVRKYLPTIVAALD